MFFSIEAFTRAMLSALPMMAYLVAFGVLYLVFAFRLRTLPGKEPKDFLNEVLHGVMWFAGAAIYPFAYSPAIDPGVRDVFNWFSSIAMVFIFLVILVIIGRQKLLVARDPSLKATRCYDRFAEAFGTTYTLRKDVMRKAFHAFIPAFVLSTYLLGVMLVNVLALSLVSGHDLGIFFIINCGFGGLFLFSAADTIRLSCFFEKEGASIFHLLPTTVLNILTKRMHAKELVTFVPTVLILLGFIPFLPAPFAVFATVSLIASCSDAIASIAGKAFARSRPNRLVFPKPSYRYFKNKNVAGYVAGAGVTFLIAWAMLAVFPAAGIDGWQHLLVALVVALVFLLVDVSSLDINDNLLNSLACGGIMLAFVLLLA